MLWQTLWQTKYNIFAKQGLDLESSNAKPVFMINKS